MAKQRLRMKDLVTEVFLYLSKKFEQSDVLSINQLIVPLEEIRSYLNEKYAISYTSNQHIFNQLRSYEDELGVPLFRKIKEGKDSDDFSITLADKLQGYKQKQLLYITQKIKIANAVFDKILHETEGHTQTPINILLGAGTEIFYVAKALVTGIREHGMKFRIYTHNLGVINYLMEEFSTPDSLELYTRNERVDPVNNILIATGEDHYLSVQFDYVVQAATYITNGQLYVESPEENIQKGDILKCSSGQKILILTKHEFISSHIQNLESYGSLKQYDFVIIPFTRDAQVRKKEYSDLLDQYVGEVIEPDITHYNYKVYRVLK